MPLAQPPHNLQVPGPNSEHASARNSPTPQTAQPEHIIFEVAEQFDNTCLLNGQPKEQESQTRSKFTVNA